MAYVNEGQISTLTGANLPLGIFVSPNQQYIFYVDAGDGLVYRREMSTPGDITTCGAATSKDISANTSQPTDLFITSDGLSLFLSCSGGVAEYSFGTAWDILSITFVQTVALSEFSGTAYCLEFKGDGTKFYVSSYNDGYIFQYSLSTAWDLNSKTYDGYGEPDPTWSSTWYSPIFRFNSTGTKLYAIANNQFREIPITTAWDATSLTTPHTTAIDFMASEAMSAYGLDFAATGPYFLLQDGGTYYFREYSDDTIETGPTGTIAITLPRLQVSAEATYSYNSISITLPKLQVSAKTGEDISATLPKLQVAAEAYKRTVGDIDVTLPRLRVAVDAETIPTGWIAATLPKLGVSASAATAKIWEISATLPKIKISAFADSGRTAEISAVIPKLSVAAFAGSQHSDLYLRYGSVEGR